tara:strand:+ start:549 stop:1379 length:831 start_codon:yes stop_codon:yes gene_type:complete
MIDINATFEIDSDQDENAIIINLNNHPYKDNDVVKFTSDHSQIQFWEDNYVVVVVSANQFKFEEVADEVVGKSYRGTLTALHGTTGNCTLTLQSLKIPASVELSPEFQLLEPSAEIELFKLTFDKNVNGQTIAPYYYHAGTNEIHTNLVFNGITYEALPVKVTGFDKTTKGTLPRPKFEISNVNSAISALVILYNPLHAEILRIKTCKKFLDAVNFTSGTNATADPSAIFEADDRWYIDRIVNENPNTVVFELTGKIDMTNLRLPKRKYRESKVKI